MDLVAEARVVEWDFTHWCYVSGYDASDPDARNMLNACWPTPESKAAQACTDRLI